MRAARHGGDGSPLGFMTGTYLHERAEGMLLQGQTAPAYGVGIEGCRQGIFAPPHNHGVPGGVQLHHVIRFRRGDAQPAPLAQGVMHQPRVLAKVFAPSAENRTGGRLARPLLDYFAVVVLRNEANLLALGLVGCAEIQPQGALPHFGLGQFSQREIGAGQLPLLERGQHIGLVLGAMGRAGKRYPAAKHSQACIVPHGNVRRTDGVCLLVERAKLDHTVAAHAGVGRATGHVFLDEVGDDVAVEAVHRVQHFVRNADALADPACVFRRLEPATGLKGRLFLGLRYQPHGHADAVVTRFLQQRCRHRTVHPTAHGHQHPRAGRRG